MSVVIKMDMPKSCGMCGCSGTGVCREWLKVDRRDMGSKRADTCPIICELPQNHGDLIDRSELLKNYDLENCTKYGNQTKEQQIHSYDTLYMYEIHDMIDDAPTVVEAEK